MTPTESRTICCLTQRNSTRFQNRIAKNANKKSKIIIRKINSHNIVRPWLHTRVANLYVKIVITHKIRDAFVIFGTCVPTPHNIHSGETYKKYYIRVYINMLYTRNIRCKVLMIESSETCKTRTKKKSIKIIIIIIDLTILTS